jgi:hypothetical protein
MRHLDGDFDIEAAVPLDVKITIKAESDQGRAGALAARARPPQLCNLSLMTNPGRGRPASFKLCQL